MLICLVLNVSVLLCIGVPVTERDSYRELEQLRDRYAERQQKLQELEQATARKQQLEEQVTRYTFLLLSNRFILILSPLIVLLFALQW